jgi:hypothetical protein
MVFNFQQFQQMSITFLFFWVRPFVNYFVCQTLVIGMALANVLVVDLREGKFNYEKAHVNLIFHIYLDGQ